MARKVSSEKPKPKSSEKPPPKEHDAVASSLGAHILAPQTIWDHVLRYGAFSWATIGIAVLVFGVYGNLFHPLRTVFPPLAIGLVITYLLNPLVSKLERGGMRRGFSVAIIFVIFFVLMGVALAFLIPLLGRQLSALFTDLPDYLDRGSRAINRFAEARGVNFRINTSSEQLLDLVKNNRGSLTSFFAGVRSIVGSAVHMFVYILLGIVFSVYLLVDLPKIQRAISEGIPSRHRDEALEVGEQVGRVLGGFFRGQLLVAAFVGVASALGLTLVKLPFAVLIGLIVGIFNLVPLIGPFIGAVPAVFIGLLSGDPIRALYAAIVLLVVQQIDNHIVSPNVMGRTVKLHPMTVMVALLTGGTIAGIFGMLLVIPMVASAKIIGAHLLKRGAVKDALAIDDAG